MAGKLGSGRRGRSTSVKVVWTEAAVGDLVGIRRYIARHDPGAARRIAQRILAAVSNLQQHPEMGRIGRLRGTHELVVTRTPFVVPYRVRDERIELLRVLHGRQDWP